MTGPKTRKKDDSLEKIVFFSRKNAFFYRDMFFFAKKGIHYK